MNKIIIHTSFDSRFFVAYENEQYHNTKLKWLRNMELEIFLIQNTKK